MMIIKTDQPILYNRKKVTRKITRFWDQLSKPWEMIWGPHIHHGYYENNQNLTPQAAQEKLIEKLADILKIEPNNKILDIGCGMGGSSLWLADQCGAMVTGITLSPKQVAIARTNAQTKNIKNVTFMVEDALSLESFADNSFDIIWSLESCEQFFDKRLFIQQAFRVLKPNGKFLLATWCSDKNEYEGKSAKKYQKLCHAFDVPYMPTIECYRALLTTENFSVNMTFDWSTFVMKSWDVGISLTNTYNFLQLIKMAGWRGWRFAKQIKMMQEAFYQNSVQYGVFLATRGISSRTPREAVIASAGCAWQSRK
jgi:tocopherol O-methyltransferase